MVIIYPFMFNLLIYIRKKRPFKSFFKFNRLKPYKLVYFSSIQNRSNFLIEFPIRLTMKKRTGIQSFVFVAFFCFFAWPITLSYSAPIPHIHKEGDGFLALYNLHLHENLALQYKRNGHFNRGALDQINHTLRCRQTQKVHVISPKLVELVDNIQDHFGGKEVQVLSGYRSPEFNASLKAHGHKVAGHSLHMQGLAMDIRIPGVSTRELREYALSLREGGVGFYPQNGFVHVDVGRVRQW